MTMNEEATNSVTDDISDDIAWTMLDLNEIIEAYWKVVAPKMRDAELDPETDRPSYEWLSANGFRGLIYALREYHDRTFTEFWANDLNLDQDDSYNWGISHDQTIDFLEDYLTNLRERAELSESSVNTIRYRLGKYVRAYSSKNNTDDLITPVSLESETPEYKATDAAWAAFDHLNKDLAPRTTERIHEAVNEWYSHLVRRKRANFNPVKGLEKEYRWSEKRRNNNKSLNPALKPEHIRSLYAAADDSSERLLVVALSGWGLRSGEVAALHRSQLVFDVSEEDVPYVSFKERKNGPSEVSILYGYKTVQDRLTELADKDDWNGYLFPSGRSSTGHIRRQTVLNWFDDLCERGGLPDEIEGQKPIPQMGRRFWYNAYSTTYESILEQIEEIAKEQGSSSPEIVLQDYLSESRRRQLRREKMREQLSSAFDDS